MGSPAVAATVLMGDQDWTYDGLRNCRCVEVESRLALTGSYENNEAQ